MSQPLRFNQTMGLDTYPSYMYHFYVSLAGISFTQELQLGMFITAGKLPKLHKNMMANLILWLSQLFTMVCQVNSNHK